MGLYAGGKFWMDNGGTWMPWPLRRWLGCSFFACKVQVIIALEAILNFLSGLFYMVRLHLRLKFTKILLNSTKVVILISASINNNFWIII